MDGWRDYPPLNSKWSSRGENGKGESKDGGKHFFGHVPSFCFHEMVRNDVGKQRERVQEKGLSDS